MQYILSDWWSFLVSLELVVNVFQFSFQSFFLFFLNFLFVFGCARSLLLHAAFLYLRRRGCSLVVEQACGFSCCGAWALGHELQQLWLVGSVALWHVGSSWTRDWTRDSGNGSRTLNHWTTREVLKVFLTASQFAHESFDRDCIGSTDQLVEKSVLTDTEPSNPWTWTFSPFL